MLIAENILLALNSIMSNKMRAFLTMLGIIIGIGSVISILTVGNSLTLTIEDNMQSMGSKDVYVAVTPKNSNGKAESAIDGVKYPESEASRKDMADSDYITGDMIKDMSDKFKEQIYAVNVSEQVGAGTAAYGSKDTNISVTGVSAGYFLTNSVEIKGGRMIGASDFSNVRNVCLVEQSLVDDLFDGKVDNALGREVEFDIEDAKTTTFTIVGVYERVENPGMGSMSSMMELFSGGSKVYIPLKAGKQMTGSKDLYSTFRVSTTVGVDTEQFANELTNYFKPYYSGNPNFQVQAITFEGMLSSLTSIIDTVTLGISIIAGIALLVGGIGVMNIMLVSVTERTREIGTRKALGARNSSIRIQFLIEAMIICLIGGIIGLILGLIGGSLLSALLGYPATPSIPGVIFSLLFSMGIGLAFGYFPADKAAKMNPIDALRYE
ncbi:MAG: ABC transporter permease [Lachnospiraceae bacterium]|nr:ABC transporter permease [Lachnospiraceae bacterium]